MSQINYRPDPDTSARIDCVVIARRHENPGRAFSRTRFIQEAVDRALADLDVELPTVRPRIRERVRATVAA